MEEHTQLNIHKLCIQGDKEQLKNLFTLNNPTTLLEQKDGEFYTPLKLACKNGHLDIVELLLSAGADASGTIDPDEAEDEEVLLNTPLYFAAQEGHVEIVNLLLRHNAHTDTQCYRGETALYIAATNGHLEVVKALVNNGASLEVESNWDGTAVMGASFSGKADVLEYLLARGANPYSEGDGSSALCLAAREGHTKAVRLLLEYGAEVDATSYMGINALCAAVTNGYTDMVKLLIKYGAEIDKAATFNVGGYLRLATKGGLEEPSISWDFMSPYHYAIIKRHTDTVWTLGLAGMKTSTLYQEKRQAPKTHWELCGDDANMRKALLHFWSPEDHYRHPKYVRKAIVSGLLVAKRQNWTFDKTIMFKIFRFVAYGWWSAKKQKSQQVYQSVKCT